MSRELGLGRVSEGGIVVVDRAVGAPNLSAPRREDNLRDKHPVCHQLGTSLSGFEVMDGGQLLIDGYALAGCAALLMYLLTVLVC